MATPTISYKLFQFSQITYFTNITPDNPGRFSENRERKKERRGARWEKKCEEDKEDWSYAATSCGMPWVTGHLQKLGLF